MLIRLFVSLVFCSLLAPIFAQSWSGNFVSTDGSFALVSQAKATQLQGTLTVNGEKGAVKGIIKGNLAEGTIQDESDTFQFEAQLAGDDMTFVFTSENLLNLPITVKLFRQGNTANANAPTTATKPALTAKAHLDERLVGTWRYTEVMSSGSGSNYFSMATDYFLQFDAQGNCASWTGNSAGGGANSGFSSGGNAVERGNYTAQQGQLTFIDPVSQQQVQTQYSIDANRMLLSNNGKKIVYERVQ